VVGNLKLFERPGGLMTSTKVTGDQWDAPFGWSPLELIAVEGLRRYGFKLEADRVAEEFLLMVIQQYRSSGTIVEKYDVLPLSTDLHGQIRFGYAANQVGFGWTNAVFTTLLDGLDSTARNRLLESGVAR
jgi:alpha,alpha-trehalase